MLCFFRNFLCILFMTRVLSFLLFSIRSLFFIWLRLLALGRLLLFSLSDTFCLLCCMLLCLLLLLLLSLLALNESLVRVCNLNCIVSLLVCFLIFFLLEGLLTFHFWFILFGCFLSFIFLLLSKLDHFVYREKCLQLVLFLFCKRRWYRLPPLNH